MPNAWRLVGGTSTILCLLVVVIGAIKILGVALDNYFLSRQRSTPLSELVARRDQYAAWVELPALAYIASTVSSYGVTLMTSPDATRQMNGPRILAAGGVGLIVTAAVIAFRRARQASRGPLALTYDLPSLNAASKTLLASDGPSTASLGSDHAAPTTTLAWTSAVLTQARSLRSGEAHGRRVRRYWALRLLDRRTFDWVASPTFGFVRYKGSVDAPSFRRHSRIVWIRHSPVLVTLAGLNLIGFTGLFVTLLVNGSIFGWTFTLIPIVGLYTLWLCARAELIFSARVGLRDIRLSRSIHTLVRDAQLGAVSTTLPSARKRLWWALWGYRKSPTC